MAEVKKKSGLIFDIVMVIFILLALFLFISLTAKRYFDSDELRHIRAARSIYHGQVPYKDFFEHHFPFLYFFLALVYGLSPDKIPLLFLYRYIMFAFACVIFYLTYRIAKTTYGRKVALYAAVFLGFMITFQQKIIEVRPDVPAIIFLLFSLSCLTKGVKFQQLHKGRCNKYFLLSGLMLACAILTTQKTTFAVIGLLTVLFWNDGEQKQKQTFKERCYPFLFVTLGFLFIFGVTCLYFLLHGALKEFWTNNVLIHLRWTNRPKVIIGLVKNAFVTNIFFCILSLAGLFCATVWLRIKQMRTIDRVALLSFTYSFIIGLFLIRAAARQYLALFIPFLAIYCGLMCDTMISNLSLSHLRRFWQEGRYFSFVSSLAYFFPFLIAFIFIPFAAKIVPFPFSHPFVFYAKIWLLLLPFLIVCFMKDKPDLLAALLLIGIVSAPFSTSVHLLRDASAKERLSNQLYAIQFILLNTTGDDTVFDGLSGLGVFRAHPGYWGYIHVGILKELIDQKANQDILSSLQNEKPKFIIYDVMIRRLSSDINQFINEHYQPTGVVENLYILKDDYFKLILP